MDAAASAIVSGPSADAAVLQVDVQAQRVKDFADALWQFTRPHTVLGTVSLVHSRITGTEYSSFRAGHTCF